LIVWSQDHASAGQINDNAIVHVSDLAPTLLELAGADPDALFPADSPDLQTGVSQREAFNGSTSISAREAFGSEMFGGRAYREGRWKITWMHEPFGTDDWQLFDLDIDPAELVDLSTAEPEIRSRLIAAFNAYAEANNVVIPDRSVFDGMEDNLPPRPPVDSPDWPRGQESNWSSNEE
jgi:arylsulfatase